MYAEINGSDKIRCVARTLDELKSVAEEMRTGVIAKVLQAPEVGDYDKSEHDFIL